MYLTGLFIGLVLFFGIVTYLQKKYNPEKSNMNLKKKKSVVPTDNKKNQNEGEGNLFT